MLEFSYMHSPFVSDLVSGSFGLGTLEAGLGASIFVILLFGMTLWSLAWKAFGLWHAAKNGQYKWFIVMLLVNTVGIVEIVYLFFFRNDRDETPISSGLQKLNTKRKEKKHAKKGEKPAIEEEKKEEAEEGHEG